MSALVLILLAVLGFVLVVGAAVYLRHRAARSPSRAADPRPCGQCKHFDLEEGQAIKASFAPFDEVSKWLRPAEMARSDERALDDPLRIPQKAGWSEFGLCHKRKESVWSGWTADKRHLAILVDKDTGEAQPDCWQAKEMR